MKIKQVTIEIDPCISATEFFKEVEILRKKNDINYKYIDGRLILIVSPITFKSILEEQGVKHFDKIADYGKWINSKKKKKDDDNKGYSWIKKK